MRKNKMIFRSIISILLAASLVLGSGGSIDVFAQESEGDADVIVEPDTGEAPELSAGQIDNAKILKEELESIKNLTPDEDYVPNEAVFLADSEEEANRVAEMYGAELKHFYLGTGTLIWPDRTVDDVFSEIVDDFDAFCEGDPVDPEKLPDTLVEPNHIWYIDTVDPRDPLYTDDSADADKQWFHGAIRTKEVWDESTDLKGIDGSGVTVAVIDTGIDTDNNDLTDSANSDHIEALYSPLGFTNGEDDNGHGTHCAGIIAALNNGIGGLGVAPCAKIVSIKAGNEEGHLETDDINISIAMAINRNVDIISMSFGFDDYAYTTHILLKKANEKGITCIAAAGNNGVNKKHYPAAYDCVISVGSYDPGKIDRKTGNNNGLANYSNWGRWVDIASPGTKIYSTMPNDPNVYLRRTNRFTDQTDQEKDGYSYGKLSGTSMATPVVSGLAALIKQAHPDFTPEQIKNVLLNSGSDEIHSYEFHVVYRGIDAPAAVITPDTDEPAPLTGPEEITNDPSKTEPAIAEPRESELTLGIGSEAKVARGKKIQIGAVAIPAGNHKILYITDAIDGVKISSSGVLSIAPSVPAGTSFEAGAYFEDNPEIYASAMITVVDSVNTGAFAVEKSHDKELSVSPNKGINSVGLKVKGADPDAVYRFVISNKKVALFSNHSTTISAKGDESVTVYAAGNGTTNITAYATDGSDRKAAAKVKCYTPITDVAITYMGVPVRNEIHVAPGGKLKFKAVSYGTSASSVTGRVTYKWETCEENADVVKNGSVKIPADSLGKTYTIRVTAENNGVILEKTLKMIVDSEKLVQKLGFYKKDTVRNKNEYYLKNNLKDMKTGAILRGADKLFRDPMTGDILGPYGFYTTPASGEPDKADYSGPCNGRYVVSVSNMKMIDKVCYGDYGITGFTLVKKGTVKIIYTATDGSGKQFVFLIKVK
ncbi:MAG: S8 family serine peptidase [Lachnospiraceae bacterium]|nr:S8 family serine peptidase [Lachnospiraceae bacterium]